LTRSVEFPKVALLAHRTRTRPGWTGAATATAETCSRDVNLATWMTSAWRSPGFRRRVRALHRVAERSRASVCIEAHWWPGLNDAPESAVVDVWPAQTEPRWARCPASDFWELLGATRAQTSGLARCHGAAGELQHEYVQKPGCL